jgi:hypothetical protein
LNDINRIISELERQRVAIERAISALRDVSVPAAATAQAPTSATKKTAAPAKKKRQLSPEGRQRIIDATKRRWAAKRAEGQKTTAKKSSPGRKKQAAKKSEA